MNCKQLDSLFHTSDPLLVADIQRQIDSHIAHGCVACRQRLQRIKEVLSQRDRCLLLPMPTWLAEQAMGLFRWKQMPSTPADIKRLPALLRLDSATHGQVAGFRSIGTMSRQLLYQAGNYNVTLLLTAAGPQLVDIMGQPMPHDVESQPIRDVDVALLAESDVVCTAKSNEFGAFILNGIAEGIYNLRMRLAEEVLEIIGLHATVKPH
ncbi:MAG: hypothetical protein RMM98_02910 [Acidobacteriota bacterium]|nr:hypothetical protein [Blastocatellia bacterium]MDW8238542.1 hypothetical protein [Acidobacteriota bacterium]